MSLRVAAVGPQGFGVYTLEGATLTPDTGQPEAIYAPGFVDIHIHGANGVDFMSAKSGEISRWAEHMAALGYEGFLPTTITAPAQQVSQALENLPDHPAILGFHLEGPFISPDFPGAQPKEHILDPPKPGSEWDAILADPRLKCITVAPERPGALDLIHTLSERGVMVGMGHTAATYAEAAAGYWAGADHTTHTFNAMRGFHHREAGMAGFALAESGLSCELIYDRLHVSPDSAKVLIAAKPSDKLIAVSDGTAAAGLPAGTHLSMWGHDGIVGHGDVRLTDGTLAGSAITLLDAFKNLAADFGVETAIRATSLNPRKLMGLDDPPKVGLVFSLEFELVERRELA